MHAALDTRVTIAVARAVKDGRSKWQAVACGVLTALSVVAVAAVGAEWTRADHAPLVPTESWQAQTNANLIARFYASVWTDGRVSDVGDFVAADHAYHDPTASAVPPGPAGVKRVVGALRWAFPDLTITVDDVIATGDRVVVRFTARGTHQGAWLGADGTGRTVATTGIAVHRVVDGQIAETWSNWDSLGMALQVGLVVVPIEVLGGGDGWEGPPEPIQPGRPS